jgi:hypothetical protein
MKRLSSSLYITYTEAATYFETESEIQNSDMYRQSALLSLHAMCTYKMPLKPEHRCCKETD